MTTVLLRHGETPLSVEKRFAGIGDIPLTPHGLAQARAAALALKDRGLDAIVTSPLARCRDTAAEVADVTGLDVRVEDGFRETDFGDFEGMTFGEVRERYPAELDAWLASTAVPPPDGESFQVVSLRVRRAVKRLLASYTGKTIVIVSHVTPIKMILRDALAAGDQFLYRLFLDPAGVSIVDSWPDGGIAVRLVNDTSHIVSEDRSGQPSA
jgi:probable phosphoglycerate mutase